MSDYKDRLFLQDNLDNMSRWLGMPVQVFRRQIENLTKAELIALKDYLDTRKNGNQFGRIAKSQCIQNRLSQLKASGGFAPLPTYFINCAERMLPKETFQKILEAAKTDQENAKRAA